MNRKKNKLFLSEHYFFNFFYGDFMIGNPFPCDLSLHDFYCDREDQVAYITSWVISTSDQNLLYNVANVFLKQPKDFDDRFVESLYGMILGYVYKTQYDSKKIK